MSGAEMNYKFGNKNNWRRTVWNRIRERLEVPPREAVVLYLAGEKDLDREVAVRHGFRMQNLIAIESDDDVAKQLRADGVLTVNDDLHRVLASWPKRKSVDVVVADLCCGLTRSTMSSFFTCLGHRAFNRATVMFNLLRGRESEEGAKELLSRLQLALAQETSEFKHRGLMLVRLLIDLFNKQLNGMDPIVANAAYERYRTAISPWICSYRSTKSQTFDTVVFNHWYRAFPKEFTDTLNGDDLLTVSWDHLAPKETKRQISAILAHRTMRLNSQ